MGRTAPPGGGATAVFLHLPRTHHAGQKGGSEADSSSPPAGGFFTQFLPGCSAGRVWTLTFSVTEEVDEPGRRGPEAFEAWVWGGGMAMWPLRVYTRKKRAGQRLNVTPAPSDLGAQAKMEAAPGPDPGLTGRRKPLCEGGAGSGLREVGRASGPRDTPGRPRLRTRPPGPRS